jgi:hypothetical protein
MATVFDILSSFWDLAIAISMVQADKAFATVKQIKDVVVTFRLPPSAQLTIPVARQRVK